MGHDRGKMTSSRCTANDESIRVEIELSCFLGTNLALGVSLVAMETLSAISPS